MVLITLLCPVCENDTRINLPSLGSGSTSRTYSCEVCKKTIIVEFGVKAAPGSNIHKNPDWLQQKYIQEDKTMQEIADICGVTPMTIRDWLKKSEIPIRSRGARI